MGPTEAAAAASKQRQQHGSIGSSSCRSTAGCSPACCRVMFFVPCTSALWIVHILAMATLPSFRMSVPPLCFFTSVCSSPVCNWSDFWLFVRLCACVCCLATGQRHSRLSYHCAKLLHCAVRFEQWRKAARHQQGVTAGVQHGLLA